MSFYCYLLCTRSGNATYIGATVDPDRRLEQHNGKRSGGARATGIQVARGEEWRRVCVITGIPEWRSALQVEWRWKQLSRKEGRGAPLSRRLRSLHLLLSLEKPTQTAIPYEAYPVGPPVIVWDTEQDASLYCALTGALKEHQTVRPASGPIPSSLVDPAVSVEIESTPLMPFAP